MRAGTFVIAQVLTQCDSAHGTFQHALMLSRALGRLGATVRLSSIGAPISVAARQTARQAGLEIGHTAASAVARADLNIVVGLWEPALAEAATRLMRDHARIVLVPTVYWYENVLPDFRGRAEALWYVSWDQAVCSRRFWDLAANVEVVRCAVDIDRFRPGPPRTAGHPWTLCRHSRDSAEKFAADVTAPLTLLGESHDLRFRMLGAAKHVDAAGDPRVEALPAGSMKPELFLRDGDVWLYAHADFWRETACIAMLEAMACGLPVVVTAAGGMREYFVHGRNGFGFTGANELCEFTRLLLEQPALRRAMAEQSRELVVRQFSLERMTEKVRSLLGM